MNRTWFEFILGDPFLSDVIPTDWSSGSLPRGGGERSRGTNKLPGRHVNTRRRLSRAKSSCIIFRHPIRTSVYTHERARERRAKRREEKERDCARMYDIFACWLKTRVVTRACIRVRRSMQISRCKTRSAAATLYANLAPFTLYRRRPSAIYRIPWMLLLLLLLPQARSILPCDYAVEKHVSAETKAPDVKVSSIRIENYQEREREFLLRSFDFQSLSALEKI